MKKFQAEGGPELIELDAIECCALAHGFAKNPETISKLMDFMDKKKLKLYADELINTEHMAFLPNDEIQTAYTQIALSELNRIDDMDTSFKCNHSREEHRKSLQSVVSRFSLPVN